MKKEQSLIPKEIESLFGSDERIAEVNKAIQRVAGAGSLEEVDTKDLIIVISLQFGKALHGLRSLKKPLFLLVGLLWLNAIASIVALICTLMMRR